MFRNAPRAALRRSSALQSSSYLRSSGCRFVSTAPPTQKSRSWKSTVARWGLAGAAVYFYNTSSVFAEEPLSQYTLRPDPTDDASDLETLDSVVASTASKGKNSVLASVASATKPSSAPQTDSTPASDSPVVNLEKESPSTEAASSPLEGSPEALEQEASSEGAFNPETGEINWECPCLGGMAHGPCGEEFKAAFSCFVYSEEEPKGTDCIEKFKGMQDCFRLHPDIYGAEFEDDDEAAEAEGATLASKTDDQEGKTERAKTAKAHLEENVKPSTPEGESEELLPKAAHDTTSLNDKK